MCQGLLHMLPYLSVIAALWWVLLIPALTDEECEAQRALSNLPKNHWISWQRWFGTQSDHP